MRKIIAVVLLFVFIYNLVGFLVVFKALQVQMRANFSNNLNSNPNNRSTTNVIYSEETKTKFSKLDDIEICYEGRMYDVVSKRQEAGHIVFTCVADVAETELIAGIETLLAKGLDQSANAGTTRQLCMFLLGFYLLPDTRPAPLSTGVKKQFAVISFQAKISPFIGLHFPPPKMN